MENVTKTKYRAAALGGGIKGRFAAQKTEYQ